MVQSDWVLLWAGHNHLWENTITCTLRAMYAYLQCVCEYQIKLIKSYTLFRRWLAVPFSASAPAPQSISPKFFYADYDTAKFKHLQCHGKRYSSASVYTEFVFVSPSICTSNYVLRSVYFSLTRWSPLISHHRQHRTSRLWRITWRVSMRR